MSQYLEILAVQSPFYIGQDEQARHMFSVNFNIIAGGPITALSQEMVKLITSNSLGTSAVDTFIGNTVPTGDGPFTLIIPTGGRSSLFAHDDEELERPSIQVLVRAKVYPTAETRILSIYRLLNGQRNVVLTT